MAQLKMSAKLVLVIAFILSIKGSAAKSIPVIGILSKPVYNNHINLSVTTEKLIDGPYINFLEAGGAKVAYINFNDTEENLKELFKHLDGMLIPGGTANFWEDGKPSKFAKTGKLMLELAMQEFDNGGYFPVWGTCLGFELMLHVLGNGSVLSTNCDCDHYGTTLQYTDKAQFSRMLSRLTAEQYYALTKYPYTYNNHQIYIKLKTFFHNDKLNSLFHVLASSKDKKGKMAYIAIVEGKKYPIYGVQFHPEKNAYMFDPPTGIDHSRASIEIMQEMSTFFVEECRKSKHSFDNVTEEAKHVVYNGRIYVDPNTGTDFYFK